MAIGDSEVGRAAQADPVSQRVQVRRAAHGQGKGQPQGFHRRDNEPRPVKLPDAGHCRFSDRRRFSMATA